VFGLLAGLVARSLVVAEEHGPQTRYRLLETIRQYGEERLGQAGEAEQGRARHAGYYAGLLRQVRDHARGSREKAFWTVRLSAEQDNLLAAWSWAISTGNVDTAFSILAGFAPAEVWSSYILLLPGEAALRLPGAKEHPGYPLALAVSALFASSRTDVTGAEELCRRAAAANARTDTPDWRVEETVCATRQNIATIRGAFADAAHLAEQAASIARAGGDLADASVELASAVVDHVIVGDAPRAVPLANEALGLAGIGASDGQARACVRESRELSTALGHQGANDLLWAAGISFLIGDWAATLKFGRRVIRRLQWGADRLRMGFVLHIIAGALATTRPDAAAIIQGAAEVHVVEPPNPAGRISSTVTAALGDERARELRSRGADMDWDQALAYALTQATQALDELASENHEEGIPTGTAT